MDILISSDIWEILMDPGMYRETVMAAGYWAPLIAILMMIIVSFLPLPAETVAIANGVVFGPVMGFLTTWVGAIVAAILAFYLARLLGRPIVYKVLPAKSLARFEEMINLHGTSVLLLVRMIPLIPYTVVNYGSGISPINIRTYVWTSALGMTLPIIAFVAVGDLMLIKPWLGWLSLVAAILLFSLLARWVYKRKIANAS